MRRPRLPLFAKAGKIPVSWPIAFSPRPSTRHVRCSDCRHWGTAPGRAGACQQGLTVSDPTLWRFCERHVERPRHG